VLQAATGPADPRIANAGAYLAWHGADPLHFQDDGGRSAEAGADLCPDPALAGRGANHKPGAGSKTGSDAVWRRVLGTTDAGLLGPVPSTSSDASPSVQGSGATSCPVQCP